MATATRESAAKGLPVAPDRLFRIPRAIDHALGEHGLIRKEDRLILLDGFLVKKGTGRPGHNSVSNRIIGVLKRLGLGNRPGRRLGDHPVKA